MTMKKGRDWSEWRKEKTGMKRLGSDWKVPGVSRNFHQDNTTASISLPREFRRIETNDRKELVKWILVFFALMFVRKIYFEMTKHERINSVPTSKSRAR